MKPAGCLRLYADAQGESHFGEASFPMHEVGYAPPAPPLIMSSPIATARLSFMRFRADWSDEAHPSPRRQMFVVLAGEVEGWTSLGDRRRLRPGDCLLMEDTTGKGHGARPVGGEALAMVIALD